MSEYVVYESEGIEVADYSGAKHHVSRFDKREEIVRCRDCKYGYEVIWPKSWDVPPDYQDCGGKLTTKWDYYNDEPQSNPVPPDGFCAWSEQKQ